MKPIKAKNRSASKRAPRATIQYETVGDALAAAHLRKHGSYPIWHGRKLKHTC
jgi:hypothetical protein